MCQSHSACCPQAQIIQEKICGNFNGVLADPVWTAPAGSYISGTFQIFNSASSAGPVTGAITPTGALSALPGNTDSVSVNNPTAFAITSVVGDSGTYCITLYKRVLA
ncbi:S-Ena type endospore appendage [Halobacillus kuroshimensis]|uniref:S-Ena type endospore appendage n=1 Tax=Halobacillus kuroshimensis TaxID=302481 RepID=UPI000481BD4B|nr:S-Ena type endospore appendage [Halobacillus kuroshimensis]